MRVVLLWQSSKLSLHNGDTVFSVGGGSSLDKLAGECYEYESNEQRFILTAIHTHIYIALRYIFLQYLRMHLEEGASTL